MATVSCSQICFALSKCGDPSPACRTVKLVAHRSTPGILHSFLKHHVLHPRSPLSAHLVRSKTCGTHNTHSFPRHLPTHQTPTPVRLPSSFNIYLYPRITAVRPSTAPSPNVRFHSFLPALKVHISLIRSFSSLSPTFQVTRHPAVIR